MTPFALDHLLVVVLTVFFPIRAATFGYRRLSLAAPDHVANVRRSLYLQAMTLQWGLSAAMLALWLWQGRSARALGLEARDGRLLAWGMVGAAFIGFAFWFVRSRVRKDPEGLERILPKLRHIERMLPHTRAEKGMFQLVSLTAGVCEELLYRGYLLWYLGRWLDMVPAVAVSSLVFGIGHSYQGVRGIVTTAVVGAAMAAIYLSCGSLWPAMAVHAIVDMHAGELAYAALSRPRDLHATPEPIAVTPAPEPPPETQA